MSYPYVISYYPKGLWKAAQAHRCVGKFNIVTDILPQIPLRVNHNTILLLNSGCERSEPVTRVGWRISLVYIFVSMGSPFGPAWAPVNAQRANIGPAS